MTRYGGAGAGIGKSCIQVHYFCLSGTSDRELPAPA
jgi:hypothetical protein